MKHRTFLSLLAIGALAATTACSPAASTAPADQSQAATALVGAPQAAPEPAKYASPDFDGDGKADFAVVRYSDDLDQYTIQLRYGSGVTTAITAADLGHTGPSYELEWILNSPLLARDLNGDGYTDLVFTERPDLTKQSLDIVFGSASGLDLGARQVIPVSIKNLSAFGEFALIQAPKPRLALSVAAEGSASRVLVFDLDRSGRVSGTPATLTGGRGKLPKVTMLSYETFALASYQNRLFMGAATATVSGKKYAGAVLDVSFSDAGVKSARIITQNSKGVPGTAAKSDAFGNNLAARDGYLAVGVPGDQVGSVKYSGAVQIFSLAGGKLTPGKKLTQASAGVPGKSERGDNFGQHVELATVCAGVTSVVVGAPNENIKKGLEDEGSAWVIPLKKAKGCGAVQLYQGHGLGGRPTAAVGVGGLLAVVRDAGKKVDDLLIGGTGGYSDGPKGILTRWSPTSGEKFRERALFGDLAGR